MKASRGGEVKVKSGDNLLLRMETGFDATGLDRIVERERSDRWTA